ncbi:MAG: phosphoglucosamine mutase [Bacilli bacterium]|jgi:phosphoglucosamine mutase|nr:phosphoglucosamine mutase [Bacilli bacterium]
MNYFGTDGIRGIANTQLSPSIAFKLGQYLGYKYQGKKILIGSDTRLSKDMLEASLCAGLTSMGANAYLVHVISTPGVSFLVKNNDFEAGIMISASHNPFYDNGLKVFNAQGEKISSELEKEIEDYLDDKIKLSLVDSSLLGQIFDYTSHINSYLNYLKDSINHDLSSFNIIVDCANGSASCLIGPLLDSLNITYKLINNEYDGKNINLNCGSTHLSMLQEAMVQDHYDLGIAFDGDADRMLALNSKGDILDGDYIIYICAKYLALNNRLNNKTVVSTIMANMGFFKALDKLGLNYVKTKVGDKYVYEEMALHDYQLGGEQSGHIIFKEFASTGDGMLSALQLLNALKELDTTIDEVALELIKYPQVLINVEVNDKDLVFNNTIVQAAIVEVEKALKDEGRVLLRASGTEPLIRVMVEANKLELAQQYGNYLVDIINQVK